MDATRPHNGNTTIHNLALVADICQSSEHLAKSARLIPEYLRPICEDQYATCISHGYREESYGAEDQEIATVKGLCSILVSSYITNVSTIPSSPSKHCPGHSQRQIAQRNTRPNAQNANATTQHDSVFSLLGEQRPESSK